MSKRKLPGDRVFCEVVITKLIESSKKSDYSQSIKFMGGLCYQALVNLTQSMIDHQECEYIETWVPTIQMEDHFMTLQQLILKIDTECKYTIDNLLFGLYKLLYPHHLGYSQSNVIHALIEQVYEKYVKRRMKDDSEIMESLFEDTRIQSQMYGYMLGEIEWFVESKFKEDEVSEVVKFGMVVVIVTILSLMLLSMNYHMGCEAWCNALESKCKHSTFYHQLCYGYRVRVKKTCVNLFLTDTKK